jgi:hypothetical protein
METGYTLTSHSLNPTQVIIDGPAELMGSISELYTDVIDLDGRTSDFSVTVNILNRDHLIVIRGNGVTEFRGILSRIVPVRNISGLPIIITDLNGEFRGELEMKTGNIHLEGVNQEALNRFEPPPDFLKVDCSGINKPGTYVLRVIAGNAVGMSIRAEPEEVKVRISLAGEE